MKTFQKIKSNVWLQYTALFAVTALLVFLDFLFFGKTFIWMPDGFKQHYPQIVNIRRMVTELVKDHTFSFWMDNMGLGGDVIGCAGIELFDPYNYIAAAFPPKYIDVGYSLSCVARLYTAGLTIMVYLNYHRVDKARLLFGGIGYAFCNWGIFVIHHGFFMLPLILFPLVILGIDKVFDGKSPVLLIVSISLSIMTFIYFAYMTAISGFVYIVFRSIFGKEVKDFKGFMLLILKFLGYIMLGFMIAAPFVTSLIYSLMRAPKFSGYTESLLPLLKELYNFIPALSGNIEFSSSYAFIGLNAISISLLPVMFINGVKKKRIIPMVYAFHLLMTLVPLWSIVMNGFNYRVYRWCYTLAFFGICATVDELSRIRKYTEKEKKICFCWVIFQMIAAVLLKTLANNYTNDYVTLSLCSFAFMMLFLLFFFNAKKTLVYLLAANIGLFNLTFYSPYCRDKIRTFLSIGQTYEIFSDSSLRAYDNIEKKDQGFFRVESAEYYADRNKKTRFISTSSNESLYWNARTVQTYVSMLDSDCFDYNDGLLNSASNSRRVLNNSFDNRLRLNFLNGVKYYLVDKDSPNREIMNKYAGSFYKKSGVYEGVIVKEAKTSPSLGYVFENTISRSEYERLGVPEKEECLMKNVVVEDEDGITLGTADLSENIRELGYRIAENSEIKIADGGFEVTKPGQKLVIETARSDKCELYVKLSGLQRTRYELEELEALSEQAGDERSEIDKIVDRSADMFSRKFNNFDCYVSYGDVKKLIMDTSGDSQGREDIHDFMCNLGYSQKSGQKITVTFKDTGRYTINDITLYAMPVNDFKSEAQALSEKQFTVTDYRSDRITGSCTAGSDGMLYISIPYHKGWTAEVDGVPTEIKKVDICYLGIPVSAGRHTVTLTYRPVYFKECLLLMAAGIAVTIVIEIVFRYNSKKRSDKDDGSGRKKRRKLPADKAAG